MGFVEASRVGENVVLFSSYDYIIDKSIIFNTKSFKIGFLKQLCLII